MKRIALLLAATAFSAPALAADIVYEEPMAPMAPAPVAIAPVESGWTGFYFGLQGGAGFNPSSPDRLGITTNGFGIGAASAGTGAPANSGFGAGSIGAAFGNSFSETFDSGFVGGAHVGYDLQFDRVVVGAVLDINATDIQMRQEAFSNTPAFYTATRDLDYLATARLRAGYLVTPSVLAYATGGAAYGDVSYSFTTDSPAATGNARSGAAALATTSFVDNEDWGYSVGGGMEVKIVDNLSFGAEYLYTNLGSGDSFTRFEGGPFDGAAGAARAPGNSTDFTSGGDFDFHTVTAKLSYRFN